MHGTMQTADLLPIQWVRKSQTLGDFTICMGTFGNGAWTWKEVILKENLLTLKVLRLAISESIVEAVGRMVRTNAALRIEVCTHRTILMEVLDLELRSPVPSARKCSAQTWRIAVS